MLDSLLLHGVVSVLSDADQANEAVGLYHPSLLPLALRNAGSTATPLCVYFSPQNCRHFMAMCPVATAPSGGRPMPALTFALSRVLVSNIRASPHGAPTTVPTAYPVRCQEVAQLADLEALRVLFASRGGQVLISDGRLIL